MTENEPENAELRRIKDRKRISDKKYYEKKNETKLKTNLKTNRKLK